MVATGNAFNTKPLHHNKDPTSTQQSHSMRRDFNNNRGGDTVFNERLKNDENVKITEPITSIDTFQMQVELAELNRRLKILDPDDKKYESRQELIESVQERDDEISSLHHVIEESRRMKIKLEDTVSVQRDEINSISRALSERDDHIDNLNATITSLNEKFHQINDSLGDIGDERQKLRDIVQELENDKVNVDKNIQAEQRHVARITEDFSNLKFEMEERKVEIERYHYDLNKNSLELAARQREIAGLNNCHASEIQEWKMKEAEMIVRAQEDFHLQEKMEKQSSMMESTIFHKEGVIIESKTKLESLQSQIIKLNEDATEKYDDNEIKYNEFKTKIDELERFKALKECELSDMVHKLDIRHKDFEALNITAAGTKEQLVLLKNELFTKSEQMRDLQTNFLHSSETNTRLNEELFFLKEEFERATKSLDEMKDSEIKFNQEMSTLRKQKDQWNKKSQEDMLSLQQQLSRKHSEAKNIEVELREEIKCLSQSKTSDVKKLLTQLSTSNESIKQQKDTISSLTVELEEERKLCVSNTLSLDKKIDLNEKMIARSNGEIDILRNKLQNSMDSYQQAKDEVHQLEITLSSAELDSAEVVAEIEEQKEKMQTEINSLRMKFAESTHREEQLRGEIKDAKENITLVESELVESQTELQNECSSLKTKVEATLIESQSTSNIFEARSASQENTIVSLKATIEQLIAANSKENRIIKDELECSKGELQSRNDRLTVERKESERTKESLEKQTLVLCNLVEQHKTSQIKLNEAEKHTKNLQEEIDQYMSERDATMQHNLDLEKEKAEQLERYLYKLNKERQLREQLQKDADSINAEITSLRKENRDIIVLEKEKLALKDKVRRQEQYMKRKITQERALKDRTHLNRVSRNEKSTVWGSPVKENSSSNLVHAGCQGKHI